jgi:hypothetical protein
VPVEIGLLDEVEILRSVIALFFTEVRSRIIATRRAGGPRQPHGSADGRIAINAPAACPGVRKWPITALPRRCRTFRRWSLHHPVCRPSCDAKPMVTVSPATEIRDAAPHATGFWVRF